MQMYLYPNPYTPSTPRAHPWYSQINYLAMLAFTLILPFLKSWGARPILVIALASIALFRQFSTRTSIKVLEKPGELISYTFWGLWAIVLGAFLWIDYWRYFECVKMLLRMIVLVWTAFAIFSRQRNHVYYLVGVFSVAVIHVLATKLGYHVDLDAGLGGEIVRDVIDLDKSRAEGLTGNANAMGFAMLSGIWAVMMLWQKCNVGARKVMRIFFLFAVVVFSYYIINTASRKSFMVVCLLLFGWFVWMLPGRFSLKNFFVAIFLGSILCVVGAFVLSYVMSDTIMGVRFQQWFDAGGGSAAEGFKENIRYWMYVDGFKFFLEHPIAGLGLGQFAAHHWSGMYSHSDYMEPLACTGLVGFILYHGFAFTVTIRIVRLLLRRITDNFSYVLKGMLLFMLCNHYLIGFGAPMWESIDHNMIVVFIGTYAWQIEQTVIKGRYVYMS